MRLGSGEHYGWDVPRPARLVATLDGPDAPGEFGWVRAEAGTGHEELDVVVRPRFDEPLWREPVGEERVQVAAWQLGAEDVAALTGATAWSPPKPLPDLWLWVDGLGS